MSRDDKIALLSSNSWSITVRILWKNADQNHAHWEQAFSADHGVSWETNWKMDFTRR
jgi:hypothetical protein